MTDETKQEIQISAELRKTEAVPPKARSFWAFLESLLGFLPSHRDSRKGRRQAQQVRAVLVVLGILLMALGGAEAAGWIVVGVALAGSAFVIPIPELKKRSWRTALQRRQQSGSKEIWVPARVSYDGRRLEVHQENQKVRQLLVDRKSHEITYGAFRNGLMVALGPKGSAKKKTVALWVPGGSTEGAVQFGIDDVDQPLRIEQRGLDQLLEAIKG